MRWSVGLVGVTLAAVVVALSNCAGRAMTQSRPANAGAPADGGSGGTDASSSVAGSAASTSAGSAGTSDGGDINGQLLPCQVITDCPKQSRPGISAFASAKQIDGVDGHGGGMQELAAGGAMRGNHRGF